MGSISHHNEEHVKKGKGTAVVIFTVNMSSLTTFTKCTVENCLDTSRETPPSSTSRES